MTWGRSEHAPRNYYGRAFRARQRTRSGCVIRAPGLRVPIVENQSGPASSAGTLRYKRVIIKLSGEALSGKEGGSGIDTITLKETAAELAEVHATGVQLGLVVGGGNIFRGLRGASEGMDRAQSDYMACWPR